MPLKFKSLGISRDEVDHELMVVLDPSNPRLITIEGTMQYCEELGIDPESVSLYHLV